MLWRLLKATKEKGLQLSAENRVIVQKS